MINNSNKLFSTFLKGTEKVISSILFSSQDIYIEKIIQGLVTNKGHGQNLWLVYFKSFRDNFQICIGKRQFPGEWKKANAAPVHKKDD